MGGMENKTAIRTRFKGPEGRWFLHSERSQHIAFNYARSTRLTQASLQGGPEDGEYVLFNIEEALHMCRYDATHREPTRTILFTTSPTRVGHPTCHAFTPAKDGNDLLVGLGDGQVMLLSLRNQLSAQPGSTKPQPVVTLVPEGVVSENNRCTALAWVPRSEGTHFVAAYSSGNIYLYNKAHLSGENGGSKFLSLGSSSKNHNPYSTIQISGGGINDMSISPDGRQLAAACRDGALRIVDIASGTVVGGFQSYYGALLCCAYSPDGRYVAAGGEDDLVALYGVQERYPVIHGEGHHSWVSRIAFDPWAPYDVNNPGVSTAATATTASSPGPTESTTTTTSTPFAAAAAASSSFPASRTYRLASVGQDASLCLWDVQVPQDGDFSSVSLLASMPMKRNASLGALAQLAMAAGPPRDTTSKGSATKLSGDGPDTPKGYHHDRKASLSKGGGICPSLPRVDMYVVQPLSCHRIHYEPLCDILFGEEAMYTADHGGVVKTWIRPQRQQQGQEVQGQQ